MENIGSPFFLHSGNHLGLVLVSHLLTVLNAKHKLGFVDAQAVWTDLHDRFRQSNAPHIFQIKQQLHGLLQGSLNVNTYYTRLKILRDELKNFQPVPICQCGGMKSWMAYQEQEYVMQFLIGLNECYVSAQGQILMLDPLSIVAKVFNLVVQDERQRTIGVTVASQGKSKKDRPTCPHYRFMGHIVDRCFKLYGYPPGYKPKSKAQSSTQSNEHTGEINHIGAVNLTDSMILHNVLFVPTFAFNLLSIRPHSGLDDWEG
ncbi:hypothetical protein Pfo_008256 [Paulownia fortunei]|nr:hypothetical protein Pfo_008256 [Paulownia fortunei]